MKKISIITPVYNESSSVLSAHDEILKVLHVDMPEYKAELIFVDDGSNDDSFAYLSKLATQHNYVHIIKLAQNVGAHMAIRAGLEHATGDVACFLACDLQDPPAIIPKMLTALKPPVQIVWAVRDSRQDSIVSKLTSRIFFSLARKLVSKNLPPGGASMFLLGSEALHSVREYTERNLTLDGLFATMGLVQSQIFYKRGQRKMGNSKWTVGKKLKLFADFFVGYSYAPIRFMSYLGISIATLGFLYAIIVCINRIFLGTPIEGWTSLMMVVLIIGGVQMTMLGIIGEYVWRSLDETRGRPRYTIEKILNTLSCKDSKTNKPELYGNNDRTNNAE